MNVPGPTSWCRCARSGITLLALVLHADVMHVDGTSLLSGFVGDTNA